MWVLLGGTDNYLDLSYNYLSKHNCFMGIVEELITRSGYEAGSSV